MFRKLYFWVKAYIWERNKEKIADEICDAIQKASINKSAIIDINENYGLKLNSEQLGKVFDNIKDMACIIVRRQI